MTARGPRPPPLSRVAYRSASRLAADASRAASALGAILAASERNNARDHLTGALLFSPGGFAGVLEGPPGAVDAALARIAADRRHADLEVLARGPARARAFARWTMSAAAAAGDDPADPSGLAPGGAAAAGAAAVPPRDAGAALVALLRRALLAAEARAGGGSSVSGTATP